MKKSKDIDWGITVVPFLSVMALCILFLSVRKNQSLYWTV